MVCDDSRAFFYAPVQHKIYVELCEEAKKTVEDNNMCAKLRMSMDGTQAAAQNWQKNVQETLATLGFTSGKVSLVLFCHPQRSLKCLAHGDDSTVSGVRVDFVWMRNELESKLEFNTTIFGDVRGMCEGGQDIEESFVGTMESGYPYEADKKHAEAIIRKTKASNLTSLEITMSKKSKEDVRDKIDDIEEVGKIGHEGTTTCRTVLEPCRNNSIQGIGSNCQFSFH